MSPLDALAQAQETPRRSEENRGKSYVDEVRSHERASASEWASHRRDIGSVGPSPLRSYKDGCLERCQNVKNRRAKDPGTARPGRPRVGFLHRIEGLRYAPSRAPMTESRPLVVLVEDEPQMRRFVRISLVSNGYRVAEAQSGEEGLTAAASEPPDVVVLDLGLPGIDGFEVLRRLREWTEVPIIVLSARGQEQDKVRALNEGADDYLTKPFGPAELVARIGVALRHAARTQGDASQAVVASGSLRIDLARRIVFVDNVEVHLTPIEYKVLATLAKHAGMVVTQRQLLRDVWGPGEAHTPQLLRVHMAQLRHKLERDSACPEHLITEPGVGYRLLVDPRN